MFAHLCDILYISLHQVIHFIVPLFVVLPSKLVKSFVTFTQRIDLCNLPEIKAKSLFKWKKNSTLL